MFSIEGKANIDWNMERLTEILQRKMSSQRFLQFERTKTKKNLQNKMFLSVSCTSEFILKCILTYLYSCFKNNDYRLQPS